VVLASKTLLLCYGCAVSSKQVTIVVLFQAPHYNCPISCSCAIPLHLCYFNTFVLFLAHTCTRARKHNTHKYTHLLKLGHGTGLGILFFLALYTHLAAAGSLTQVLQCRLSGP
jgi:hypothetical protein